MYICNRPPDISGPRRPFITLTRLTMKRLLIATVAAVAVAATVSAAASDAENRSRVYLVSDAHLDTQWEWDIQTTIQPLCPEHRQPEPDTSSEIPRICVQLRRGREICVDQRIFSPRIRTDETVCEIRPVAHSNSQPAPQPASTNSPSTADLQSCIYCNGCYSNLCCSSDGYIYINR